MSFNYWEWEQRRQLRPMNRRSITDRVNAVDWLAVRLLGNGLMLRGQSRSLGIDKRGLNDYEVDVLTEAKLWEPCVFNPLVYRWRQYFLEQIHASQTVTEQP